MIILSVIILVPITCALCRCAEAKLGPRTVSSNPMTMTTGVVIIPYIIPMLLGRTFDWFTSQVGVDIFPKSAVDTPVVIRRSFVSSDFRVIKNDSEARQFLGISDDLSLRVKAGVLHIAATGDYLKDVQTRDNYVEILVKSRYETLAETLHGSVDPITDWDLQSPTYLGSHFVRSITYGGMLLASLRLYARNHNQKEDVESFLDKYFSVSAVQVAVVEEPGQLNLRQEYHTFEEKIRRMVFSAEEHAGNDLGLRIKYYSTVSAPFVPQDIDSFLSLLEQFPAEASKLNGGRGVPLIAELVPLNELSSRMMALMPNKYLDNTLKDMDDKFSDLLLTHQSIRDMANQNADLSKSCQVRDLDHNVHGKIDIFKDVIRHLNTASPSTIRDSQKALRAYSQGEVPNGHLAYYKQLQHIQGLEKKQTGKHHSFDHHPGNKPSQFTNQYSLPSSLSPLDHFGYLVEMSMANGVCASFNKFSGSFLTLRRNCSIGVTCSEMCWALRNANSSPVSRVQGVECLGVVVAELHVSNDVAVGAKTVNLGRSACDRRKCFHEYCCCRMSGHVTIL